MPSQEPAGPGAPVRLQLAPFHPVRLAVPAGPQTLVAVWGVHPLRKTEALLFLLFMKEPLVKRLEEEPEACVFIPRPEAEPCYSVTLGKLLTFHRPQSTQLENRVERPIVSQAELLSGGAWRADCDSPGVQGLTVEALPHPLRANAKRKSGFVDPFRSGPRTQSPGPHSWTAWVRCKDQVPLFLATKSFPPLPPRRAPEGRCASLRSAMELAFCPGSHTHRHPLGSGLHLIWSSVSRCGLLGLHPRVLSIHPSKSFSIRGNQTRTNHLPRAAQ